MTLRAAILACLLALIGCAPRPPVDVAQMPPESGLADPANAIQYSAWAFALSSRTRGDPATAARAVAAIDYAAGAMNTNPTLQYLSPIVNDEMLEGREAVRRVLGISPAATSQAVVNAMVTVWAGLSTGNQPAVQSALESPIFTLGPQQTLAILANLPFIHIANVATIRAEGVINSNGNGCSMGCMS